MLQRSISNASHCSAALARYYVAAQHSARSRGVNFLGVLGSEMEINLLGVLGIA
jgi:hypothetical protein